MFDQVGIRVSDRAASERFHETVLRAVESEPTFSGENLVEWDDFALSQASEERPVTKRLHVGFVAPSREHVDAFWRAGTEAGSSDDDPPVPRQQYRHDSRSSRTGSSATSRRPGAAAPRSRRSRGR
jgi:hypothetical protein